MKYIVFIISLLTIQLAVAQTPSIKVLDTDFFKGTLNHKQTVTLR